MAKVESRSPTHATPRHRPVARAPAPKTHAPAPRPAHLERAKAPPKVHLDARPAAGEAPHATGFSLGNAAAQLRSEHGRVVVDPALAELVHGLLDDPRMTWNMRQKELLALIGKVAGARVTETDLWKLQRQFPKLVPSTNEIRQHVIGRVVQLIAKLHQERGIATAVEMVDVLKDEFSIKLKNANTIRGFRRYYPDLVPRFLEGTVNRYEVELKRLVDAVKAAPDKSYADVARTLGLTPERAGIMMLKIRDRWPDALPEAHQHELWTDAELKSVREALDDLPLSATQPDLVETLRTEAPELFDRHPLDNSGVLAQALRRSFGIDDWQTRKEKGYAQAFADLAARSPPETTLYELVEQLREDNPGAYSYLSVQRLLKKWVDDPAFKEIAALRDKDGQYGWQRVRTKYTEALARRVGDVIRAHPGESLQFYVQQLQKDPAFAKQNPLFSIRNVQTLRGLFPEIVPHVTSLQVHGRTARLAAWKDEMKGLAEKVAAAADQSEHPSGLTLTYLARKLKVTRERVGAAVRAHPAMFPWFRSDTTPAKLDLELAMRVAVEMSRAPMGSSRADVIAKVNGDPEVHASYPPMREDVIDSLRRRYPELIPEWRVRDQVLRSKLLSDALFRAPKGTPFEDVVAQVSKANPEAFRMPWASPTWVHRLWEDNPERFPFLDALKKGGKLDLRGRGAAPPASDEDDVKLANRLARIAQLPDRLPVVERIVSRMHEDTLRGFDFLFVQHLLGAQGVMFDALAKIGASKNQSTIVGVPYSSTQDVTDLLSDKGWDVRRPPLDMDAMEEAVRDAMKERIAEAEKSGHKIIVIDDGGMVAQLLDSDPELKAHAELFRIVEQTRRGITVADAVDLRTAVVNVAQSWGKFVEGPMIGDSLREKALDRLKRIGVKSLKGMRVGVVGFGTIGAPWADYLKRLGAHVTVLDNDEATREQAKKAGFKVADDRAAFFSHQQVFFGATGVQSITADDLKHMPDGAIVGSGSSKLVEIDVAALDRHGKPRVVEDESQPPTVEYNVGGHKLRLLARGFPLNFDGSSEIVPYEKIQLTIALLVMGAIQATSANVASVQRLDPKLQLEVLEYFAQENVAGEAEIASALAEARAALKKLVPA